MNSRERKCVRGLIDAFTQLRPSAESRLALAESLRLLNDFDIAQVMDFEGHLDPARGPDSIASSSPDLLRCLQTGYSNYLPEHAMCRESDCKRDPQ